MALAVNQYSLWNRKEENCEVAISSNQPNFRDYQLLGDSIFVRFANNVLGQPSHYVDGTPTLGFCVSGQRIKQLTIRIKKSTLPLNQKVILLIGTNDVMCGQSYSTIIRHFQKLVQLLLLRKVSNIVILTLPPIPRLALQSSHWEVVSAFNEFLLFGLQKQKFRTIRVLDIFPRFIKVDPRRIIDRPVPQYLQEVLNGRVIQENTSPNGKRASSQMTCDNGPNNGTLKKQKTFALHDPTETEEMDELLTDFGRYVNRENRADQEKEVLSDDEDQELVQVTPRIDYRFWKRLKFAYNLTENPMPAPLPLAEVVNPQSGNWKFTAPSATAASTSPASPVYPTGRRNSEIMRLTDTFLRLECFEMCFGNNPNRMDLLHPNKLGLETIRTILEENL